MKTVFALFVSLALAAASGAQSFNTDMNDRFASVLLGGGVPSPTFSGAPGGLPGYWNNISDSGFGTNTLRGLDGNLTSVQLIGPSGGGGGGTNLPQNTGDYAALLNDAREVGFLNFSIEGLTNGTYRLYTYVGNILLPYQYTRTSVSVLQASTPPQFAEGEMPGNQFLRGNTHTEHDLIVSNGVVNVSIDTMVSHATFFSGFQLVSVPEPTTIVFLSASLLGFIRKRRNS